ncbi:ribonuclease E [Albidovulum inexpectatum]|uniref:Ribonuclease E n=1 Tax=Albidovulum inexpectatum TaxID=196587 RepID=A0A2S5JEW3_9RHOB|nr:ribonuclease E/G [Albidovulum inexpectatum]PPB80062.1 ribonuclease E [Albidovulum inexpectatum]
MAKKMLIDATHPEETRVVVVDGNKVEEFDFETANKRQIAGNIYLAKVTRVEPSLQAAFVDYGGNRHGFLAFSEIHPDYYQIPVADRQALLAEERAAVRESDDEDSSRARRKAEPKAESAGAEQAATTAQEIPGMAVVDLADEEDADSGPIPVPGAEQEPAPYVAADHATETDPEIESVADEDVAEEIRPPRRPRPRRYKIQEVIKVRQIMLVQVVKEERGNKGAALTTYLSLAGRYCVLMPNTARGGGISRKITNAADRKRLKQIASELDVPEGAGLIIRTAGSERTKAEIKRDYEYLLRLWEKIRELTLKSIAPAPIYEEGDLIKRAIRDYYSRDIDEVLVEGEQGYRTAKDFMKMIMPSHAKNVKLYNESQPLFARYQVESYLASMFNPVVQLPSGGYIVIDATEALVAIDVNSGKATKKGSVEETALQTNLEAAEEIARQLRLRDLAGLIVIDFIDMEERKNNAAVEKRLKEKLKSDRARIQVGRISGFGLLEMSRQRLRPGMVESTTAPCPHCHGTGIIRSDDSVALQIIRQIEEEGTRKRSREVLVRAPVPVMNYLINNKREHLAQIEARYGMSVRIEADPTMISPDYSVEKFKTATRNVPEFHHQVVKVDVLAEDDDVVEDEGIEDQAPDSVEASTAEGEAPKKKKRRRRRRRKGNGASSDVASPSTEASGESESDAADASSTESAAEMPDANEDAQAASSAPAEAPEIEAAAEPAKVEEKPKRTRTRGGRKSAKTKAAEAGDDAAAPSVAAQVSDAESASDEASAGETEEPARKTTRKRSSRSRSKAAEATDAAGADQAEETPKPKTRSRSKRKKEADAAPAETVETTEAPVVAEPTDTTAMSESVQAEAEPEAQAEMRDQPGPENQAPAPAAEPAGSSGPAQSNGEASLVTEHAGVESGLDRHEDTVESQATGSAPIGSAEQAETPSESQSPEPRSSEPQAQQQAAATEESGKPRRRGWWSLGR